jgi:hypothetical protein
MDETIESSSSVEVGYIENATTIAPFSLLAHAQKKQQKRDNPTHHPNETTTTTTNEDNDDESMLNMKMCTLDPESGTWTCHPYKRDILRLAIEQANSNGISKLQAALDTLAMLKIDVHIVEGSSTNILKDIIKIIDRVTKENQLPTTSGASNSRCLLYQDFEGRLYNLILPGHAIGPAAEFYSLMESFSGFQAMVAVVVLCRSLPCAFQEDIGQLKPAYLSLVLGLVLSEEISQSWLNVALLVRAVPSVSAFTLTTHIKSDWIRKLTVLMLAVAGTVSGPMQTYMTTVGIALAGNILLANLGSRAWHSLHWKPLRYNGPLASVVAWLCAVFTGILVPYMGHREIEAGGKRALEAIMSSALLVAIFFGLSDLDQVQQFIVLGSASCEQKLVNIVIGIWWTLTLLLSLLLAMKIPPQSKQKDEPLLVESQASPVGFTVPNLPDFEMDPNVVQPERFPCPIQFEFAFGIVLTICIGGAFIYVAYTDWGN